MGPTAVTQIVYDCKFGGACALSPGGELPHVLFSLSDLNTGGAVLSPGGKQAAFTASASGRNYFENLGLWVSSPSGAGARRLAFACTNIRCGANAAVGQPAWDRSGTRLAVVEPVADTTAYAPPYQVWVVDVGDGKKQLVPGSTGRCGLALAWSPDGNDLACAGPAGLVVFPVGGGRPRILAQLPTRRGARETISWSPDGRTILFADGGPAVHSVPAAGGAVTSLFAGTPATAYGSAFWSPDGSRMVVGATMAEQPVPHGYGRDPDLGSNRVFTADPAGGTVTTVSTLPGLTPLTGWVDQPPPGATTVPPPAGYAEVTADGTVTDFGSGLPARAAIPRLSSPIVAAADPGSAPFRGRAQENSSSYYLATGAGTIYDQSGYYQQMLNYSTASPAPLTVPVVAAAYKGGQTGSTVLPLLVGADGSEYPITPAGNPPGPYSYSPTEGPIVAVDGGSFVTAKGVVTDPYYGDLPSGLTATGPPSAPIVGIARDGATGDGYWLVGSDGAVYGIGAPVLGSLAGRPLPSPIVGIAADDTTGGYWLAARDGTVYGFDAPLRGSTASKGMSSPTLGLMTRPSSSIVGPQP